MTKLLSMAAFLGGTISLNATPVLIDNFSTDQFVSVGPSGTNPLTNTGGILTGTNSIGGARTISITRTAGSGFDYVQTTGGIARVLSGDDEVTASFTWDGDIDPALNATGLGGIDLTGGGSNIYFYLASRSDAVGPISVTIYSDAGNASRAMINSPGTGFGSAAFASNLILFSAFSNFLGSGATFTNVGAIVVTVDGTGLAGLDTQIDLIEATSVPEPGTLAFVAIGLGLTAFSLSKRH
jgi:hypothetical protein